MISNRSRNAAAAVRKVVARDARRTTGGQAATPRRPDGLVRLGRGRPLGMVDGAESAVAGADAPEDENVATPPEKHLPRFGQCALAHLLSASRPARQTCAALGAGLDADHWEGGRGGVTGARFVGGGLQMEFQASVAYWPTARASTSRKNRERCHSAKPPGASVASADRVARCRSPVGLGRTYLARDAGRLDCAAPAFMRRQVRGCRGARGNRNSASGASRRRRAARSEDARLGQAGRRSPRA